MNPDSLLRSVFATQKSYWLVALVIILAMVAWTSTLVLGSSGEDVAFGTATPTKTPGAYALDVDSVDFPLTSAGLLPTSTPAPIATTQVNEEPPQATAAPQPVIYENTPEPWLVEIVRTRGLNPDGRYVVIDQTLQKMHVVNDGILERVLDVTTGDPEQGWDTPAWFGVIGDYWGTFEGLGGVLADEGWWLFERGGNFLIHSLPYTFDTSGQKQYKGWRDLGAAPASHGCIRLSPEDALWFSSWKPAGAPIIILPYPDTPDRGA